jgi:hypothetical protein
VVVIVVRVIGKGKLAIFFIHSKVLPYFSVCFLKFDALMIKKLLPAVLICWHFYAAAQTIKTDVLVIGGGPLGVAAALQSARSKVKTVLAMPPSAAGNMEVKGMVTIRINANLPSGIWGEFRKRICGYYKNAAGYDTLGSEPLKFDAAVGWSVLEKMTDSIKDLTVYKNASFIAIKNDGDKWETTITQNGKTIKIIARAVVDATPDCAVAIKAGGKPATAFKNINTPANADLYRTCIATWGAMPPWVAAESSNGENERPYPAEYMPMRQVLVTGAENIFCLSPASAQSSMDYLPLGLQLGQGAGAMAAYIAFFKTTTAHLNVRKIQGELLDFKAYLLPFTDIKPNDPDWRAVQQIGLAGVLYGLWRVKGSTVTFNFEPDSPVGTSQLQPSLQQIYTRAFLWFNREKPGSLFTIGNMLSFISDYTLTDPVLLKTTIQRAWKTQFKFNSDFDIARPITRREFAVLANKYLNPFARTVDLDGRLVN